MFRSTKLNSVTIPNGVTEIKSGAFTSCYFLTNVLLADSVTVIEDSAFENCSKLEGLYLKNVEYIGSRAFMYCSKLKNIVLGPNLTYIGREAFYGCTSLSSLILSDNIVTIDKAFTKCENLTLYIEPANTKQGWSLYDYNYRGPKRVYACVLSGDKAYVVSFTKNTWFDSYYSSLDSPYREGYIFTGWYKTPTFLGSEVTDPYNQQDNTKLYAKWDIIYN